MEKVLHIGYIRLRIHIQIV